MQFIVEPEIFDRFPNMCLAVVVAHGIDNQTERPEINANEISFIL
jgi:DNA/RNA-binding domain of Phe-tRNA-synthetase-like protein